MEINLKKQAIHQNVQKYLLYLGNVSLNKQGGILFVS